MNSLMFTLSLILIISRAPMLALGDRLYEIVCKEAEEDTARCLRVLKADPRIVSANNYLDLCKFILEMAIKKGNEGLNYFSEVMKKQPSLAMKQCSTICYGGAIASLERSMDELVEEPKGANYDARVAGDGPANCESAIAAGNIKDLFMHDLNNEMSLLCKIADLATNHLIQKNRFLSDQPKK